MDILISSNLERLLYFAAGPETTKGWMASLAETGRFAIGETLRRTLAADFTACYLDEDETRATIRSLYREYGYLCDPHTAVAAGALRKYPSSVRRRPASRSSLRPLHPINLRPPSAKRSASGRTATLTPASTR